MVAVAPWTSVEPSQNPAAILGVLPFLQGTVTYAIPASVVPDRATGILVFAWAALAGVNADLAWWHFAVNIDDRVQNWFALIAAGDPQGGRTAANSQAFWLPFPSDRTLHVTLAHHDLVSPANRGTVEIHGYCSAPA
jgi:hypothetical protein